MVERREDCVFWAACNRGHPMQALVHLPNFYLYCVLRWDIVLYSDGGKRNGVDICWAVSRYIILYLKDMYFNG